MAEAVIEQYPAFGKSIPYCTVSVDKLLSLSKMIVRDLLGILRKETATAALPALLPPPPAVPSMIYPPPPEWFLLMLANKITTPPTTVVPIPQFSTVVLQTLDTKIGPISLDEPPARTQAPSTGADLPGDSSQVDNVAPSLDVSDNEPQVTNVAQGVPGVEFNASEFTDVLEGLDQIQTPIITTHAPQEATRRKTTALTMQVSKSGQSSKKLCIAPKKCAPKPSKPKRLRQNSPPQESASITATSEQIEVVLPTAPPVEIAVTARGTPRRQTSKQANSQIHSTKESSPPSGFASKSPTLRQSTISKKRNTEDTETISSSSESSELSDTDLAEASEGMKKWKCTHKIKSRKFKSFKQTRLSHTRKVQSAPSVSKEHEGENLTESKPMDKTKAQSPA